jgi:hypothetical protein
VVEMRSGHIRRLSRLGIGALVLLVFHEFCAPGAARAGCNHLVVSRTDAIQFSSLVDPLLDDLAARPERSPASPRSCTGAWCSGQPVVPPVPAGARDWRVESWAWNACGSVVFPPSFSFLPVDCPVTNRIVRGCGIFHPPRILSSV